MISQGVMAAAVARGGLYAKNPRQVRMPPIFSTCSARCLRIAAVSALMLGAFLNAGCVESTIAAAGATAGFGLAQGQAESFIRGELKSARLVPIAAARQAVLQTMGELQLQILEQRQSRYQNFYRAKADGGREIKIYLKADSAVITRFTVRVGMMGDSAVSRVVMSRIDAALGDAALAPVHD